MVCHVCLQVLLRDELFLTVSMRAWEHDLTRFDVLPHLVRVEALHGSDKSKQVDLVVVKLVIFLVSRLNAANSRSAGS